MRSPNGSIHTTQTPPPLSFYNTFNIYVALGKRHFKREAQTVVKTALQRMFQAASQNNIYLQRS